MAKSSWYNTEKKKYNIVLHGQVATYIGWLGEIQLHSWTDEQHPSLAASGLLPPEKPFHRLHIATPLNYFFVATY